MMTGATTLPITLDSKIRLHPLSEQRENGVVIIGRGDQFLELPSEGTDFLTWLAQGNITRLRLDPVVHSARVEIVSIRLIPY